MTTPIKFTSKQSLLDALEAERPRLKQQDARVAAKHRVEERAYHVEFKAKARQLAKMSYADLKALGRYADKGVHWSPPSCPVSQVAFLDRTLTALRAGTQERFTIKPRGPWHDVWRLLNPEPEGDGTVC